MQLSSAVTEDDIASLIPLDSELDNLLKALETGWKMETTAFQKGLRGALYYGYIRGQNRVFLLWAERAHEIVSDIADIKERVNMGIALYLIFGYIGNFELVELIGNDMGRDAESHHYLPGIVTSKLILAYAAQQLNKYDLVMRLSREAMAQTHLLKNDTSRYRPLRLTAWLLLECASQIHDSDPEAARSIFLESEALIQECLAILPAHSSQMAFTLSTFSSVLFSLGKEKEAYEKLKLAQRTAIEQGMQVMLIFCCQKESRYAMDCEQFEYAAVVFGAYLALQECTDYIRNISSGKVNENMSTLKEKLGSERYETLLLIGQQILPDELARMSITCHPQF